MSLIKNKPFPLNVYFVMMIFSFISINGCGGHATYNQLCDDKISNSEIYKSIIFGTYDGGCDFAIRNFEDNFGPRCNFYSLAICRHWRKENHMSNGRIGKELICVESIGETYYATKAIRFCNSSEDIKRIDFKLKEPTQLHVPVGAMAYIGHYSITKSDKGDQNHLEINDGIEQDIKKFKEWFPKLYNQFKDTIYNSLTKSWYREKQ